MRADNNAVWEAIFAKLERFREERRVGTVSYDEANGAIVFHYDEQTTRCRYWIPFDELQEPEGQLRWLYHVRSKGWFTARVLDDFLDVLEYLGFRPAT